VDKSEDIHVVGIEHFNFKLLTFLYTFFKDYPCYIIDRNKNLSSPGLLTSSFYIYSSGVCITRAFNNVTKPFMLISDRTWACLRAVHPRYTLLVVEAVDVPQAV